MADHSFTGSLYVEGNVGIGTEPLSNAQLYTRSSNSLAQVLLENSNGAILKLAVDTSEVTIGTDTGITQPLTLNTNGQTRLSIASDGAISISENLSVQKALSVTGNVAIGTATTSATLNVQGTLEAKGGIFTGPLTVQDTVTIMGNVGIGTLEPQGKLDVRGAIHAGNSDIYFTKTDHRHTAFGNTAGFAAIENSANYEALMILGRAGTSQGRAVKLWDYLQVNGNLEVTGNISGRVTGIGFASASVSNGQSIPIPSGFRREECVFFAAIKYLNIAGDGGNFIANCTVDRNGKVNLTPDGRIVASGFSIAKKGGW
jgi:cytoskeletal protein CcmA (bactofilin family)